MIKVIDNCIPLAVQNQIEEMVCNKEFAWHLTEDIVKQNTTDSNPGFNHVIKKISNSRGNNSYFDFFIAVLHFAAEKANIEIGVINNNIRLFMLTNYSEYKVHAPHVDLDIPHLVMLYYIKDSDGPTHLYNKDMSVMKKIEPKKGRCVFFRGDMLHGSSTPVKNYSRIVINYNFNLGTSYNTYDWSEEA